MSPDHALPGARGFHVLAKPAGPRCNLSCTYCFYLEKERLWPTASPCTMSPRVLETFIRDYIAAQDAPVVTFSWQGGEPTLVGLDFFRAVVAWQREYANGRRIENAFQTNGVLIDDAWSEFLAEHRVLVGLSVDGPRDHHDRYRRDRGGAPTFDRVMATIERLHRHHVAFNTLTAVHRDNARDPLGVYRFLREVGSGFIQLIPIVERVDREGGLSGPGSAGSGRVTPWSVVPDDYGAFLCAVFDEWVRRDVGTVFVQAFDVALENWYRGSSSLCLFSETCGRALAIEHDGDLYACDHYVFPAFRRGNVVRAALVDMVEGAEQVAFGLAKRDSLPAWCRQCPVQFACHGECPKNRFVDTPDGEPGLNYLCPAYRRFFTHIGPCMRFMADELAMNRPPANVMAWARAQDRERAIASAGRNDPCPCGSGRKFKKCCGTRG